MITPVPRVHQRRDGSWAPCHATVRACPRRVHLDGYTVAAARDLPQAFLEQLLGPPDPPTKIAWAQRVQIWQDAQGHNHRANDLPAVVERNGSSSWWVHGKRHRAGDKPASVYANGAKRWFKHGELHRTGDRPAIVWADGSQFWYKHGKLHREDGKPAAVYATGRQEWWVNGQRQCTNDPNDTAFKAGDQRLIAYARTGLG